MTATIHPCAFESRPCDNYGCRNAFGFKKYFIGRPDVGVPKPIFCEACMKNLVKNLPVDLVEGGADLQDKIRGELQAEFDAKLSSAIDEALANAALLAPAVEQPEEVIEVVVEKEPEVEMPKMIYRCLDCNEEFDTANGLNGHKKKHK